MADKNRTKPTNPNDDGLNQGQNGQDGSDENARQLGGQRGPCALYRGAKRGFVYLHILVLHLPARSCEYRKEYQLNG